MLEVARSSSVLQEAARAAAVLGGADEADEGSLSEAAEEQLDQAARNRSNVSNVTSPDRSPVEEQDMQAKADDAAAEGDQEEAERLQKEYVEMLRSLIKKQTASVEKAKQRLDRARAELEEAHEDWAAAQRGEQEVEKQIPGMNSSGAAPKGNKTGDEGKVAEELQRKLEKSRQELKDAQERSERQEREYDEAVRNYEKEKAELDKDLKELEKRADELRKFRRPPHVDDDGGVYYNKGAGAPKSFRTPAVICLMATTLLSPLLAF